MMAEVLRKLSKIENRQIEDVSQDLRHPFADTLRLRVKSRFADSGTLPLVKGLRLFEGSRKLLISAACSTVMPQAFYPRKSLKGVKRTPSYPTAPTSSGGGTGEGECPVQKKDELVEELRLAIAEEYNKGLDVEGFFAKLTDFVKELSQEEQRGVTEKMSEEELALFDILPKPEIDITKSEKEAVK